MAKKITLSALLISYVIFSCTQESDDNCIGYSVRNVISVEGDTCGLVNEVIDLDIRFAVMNGCGRFDSYLENFEGDTAYIVVKAIYEGCACTMNIPIITSQYHFESNASGIYNLAFKSGDEEYITHTITIN